MATLATSFPPITAVRARFAWSRIVRDAVVSGGK
jgi:hypothetical protein